jgi:hypothetical protein
MPKPKYACIKIWDIPDEFINKYKLSGLDRDGWIYFKIHQGCSSLPQAGILADNFSAPISRQKAFMRRP